VSASALGCCAESRFPIINRLDAALERFVFRQMEVRAIYLTSEDHDALDRAESARFKRKISVLEYRGHEIRRGNTSRIYSTHGVDVVVPKRLSPRVEAAA
jgi:hypothetical protein